MTSVAVTTTTGVKNAWATTLSATSIGIFGDDSTSYFLSVARPTSDDGTAGGAVPSELRRGVGLGVGDLDLFRSAR